MEDVGSSGLVKRLLDDDQFAVEWYAARKAEYETIRPDVDGAIHAYFPINRDRVVGQADWKVLARIVVYLSTTPSVWHLISVFGSFMSDQVGKRDSKYLPFLALLGNRDGSDRRQYVNALIESIEQDVPSFELITPVDFLQYLRNPTPIGIWQIRDPEVLDFLSPALIDCRSSRTVYLHRQMIAAGFLAEQAQRRIKKYGQDCWTNPVFAKLRLKPDMVQTYYSIDEFEDPSTVTVTYGYGSTVEEDDTRVHLDGQLPPLALSVQSTHQISQLPAVTAWCANQSRYRPGDDRNASMKIWTTDQFGVVKIAFLDWFRRQFEPDSRSGMKMLMEYIVDQVTNYFRLQMAFVAHSSARRDCVDDSRTLQAGSGLTGETTGFDQLHTPFAVIFKLIADAHLVDPDDSD